MDFQLNDHEDSGNDILTGATFSFETLATKSLSYTQLPKMLPKFRSARFIPSVVPSFFAFSKAAALPLQFSM